MALMFCSECEKEVSDKAAACPNCGAPIAQAAVREGYAQKFSEHFGSGCLVQGVGVILLFVFPIGTLFGVVLLVVGSRMASGWKCSECQQKIPSRDARSCASCGASLRAR